MRWFGLSFAPCSTRNERFVRRYRNEPSPKFSLTLPCSGIIHLLSGVNVSRTPTTFKITECTQTHTHTYSTYTYTYTYICFHTYMHMHISKYPCIHISMYMYMHMYLCIHVFIHVILSRQAKGRTTTPTPPHHAHHPPTHPPQSNKWNSGVQRTMFVHVTFYDGLFRVHACNLPLWVSIRIQTYSTSQNHTRESGITSVCIRNHSIVL